jgi:hypothetical protein
MSVRKLSFFSFDLISSAASLYRQIQSCVSSEQSQHQQRRQARKKITVTISSSHHHHHHPLLSLSLSPSLSQSLSFYQPTMTTKLTRVKLQLSGVQEKTEENDDDNALFTFNEHRAENCRSLMATAFSYSTTTN